MKNKLIGVGLLILAFLPMLWLAFVTGVVAQLLQFVGILTGGLLSVALAMWGVDHLIRDKYER